MLYGHLKLVWVGDKVGKTTFLIRATTGSYPYQYIPSVFDPYALHQTIDGSPVAVVLWDIPMSQPDRDRLRPPCDYPHTDVFLACFDVTNRASFESIKSKWVPELRRYKPDVPIVLIGHKIDMRWKTVQMGEATVSMQEGVALATSLGCVCYRENSALTGKGVADTVHTATEVAASYTAQKSKRKIFQNVSNWLSTETTRLHRPVLPPAGPSPQIRISPSTFAEEWGKMLEGQSCTDVKFVSNCGPPVEAHKVILSAASPLFREIFLGDTDSQLDKDNVFEDLSCTCDDGDECPSLAHSRQGCPNGKTVVSLNPSICSAAFHQVVLFLYKGLPDLSEGTDIEFVSELKGVAEKFQFSWLCQICENLCKDEAYLNPSISSWLNDNTGTTMKDLFLNKDLMSDVKFCVENTTLYAHRVVLIARCDVMAAMLGGAFRESSAYEIEISDTSIKCFLALLEYLYTDHAPLEECDPVDLMKLADRFCLPRLVALCELHIARDLEKMMREEAADRACAVIHLLLTAQAHNASQLAEWCLHFISTNYPMFAGLEEFSLLQEEHRKYVEEHRWPPLSHLEAVKEYDKATGRREKTSRCKVM